MKKYSALLVILGAALWGTDALFRRPLTARLSPITIVLLEHCVLSLAMFPVVCRLRREFALLRVRHYAALLFIAAGGSAAATSLFTLAIQMGNPSVMILLQKTQPLFTVLLARLILRERLTSRFWAWFAAALTGAYLMSAPDWREGVSGYSGPPAAVFSALGAAALWGSATVFGRYVAPRISAFFLTGLRFLFALPFLIVLFLLQLPQQRALPVDVSSIASVVGMALVPGLAALLVYYKGLQFTSASIASICELSFPITAVAVNWLFLGFRLSPPQLLGSAILIYCVTSLARTQARATGTPAVAAP